MIGRDEPKVEQPGRDAQMDYLSVRENDATEVYILGTKKKYRLRWLKNGQIAKLSRLILRKRKVEKSSPVLAGGTAVRSDAGVWNDVYEDAMLSCKAAAIVILDGYWKLFFRYWLLWRWFYYVKQYDTIQMKPILDVGKKKVPVHEFLAITTSLTELRDTLMIMRTEEAEAILREQASAQRGPSAKSDQS